MQGNGGRVHVRSLHAFHNGVCGKGYISLDRMTQLPVFRRTMMHLKELAAGCATLLGTGG